MEPKVLAYITIYEDREAAINCLQAIESQTISIDSIFIVDNSNKQLLTNLDSISLLIHHFPSNIGISQGLILALKWGIQEDYEFLWTFDQDSIPSPDCLAVLLAEHQNLTQQQQPIGIVAPLAFDRRSQSFIGGINFKNDKFIHCVHRESDRIYECDAPITSGSLIDLHAASLSDLPIANLFIDGVDFDYGLKLKQQGFKNFVVTTARLDHNYGTPIAVKILNFSWIFQSYSPLRYYYSCRNTTYLVMHYASNFFKVTAAMHRIKTTILKIAAIMVFEKSNKRQKIYACLLGTYHGFCNKLDRTWP
jgi:rhamnosyltransferase